MRVLLDGIGQYYGFSRTYRLLRAKDVRTERFLPPSLLRRGVYVNLRLHRKLLVVDGRIGFTAGLNIRAGHLLAQAPPRKRIVDMHFRVEGPAVRQMEEAFLDDWCFVPREPYQAPAALPTSAEAGKALCRGISAGPNEGTEKLHWILTSAISCAKKNVRIMTPYFIPDRVLTTAIGMACMRGTHVDIILPAKNNLPFVNWASQAFLWEILQHGARVYYQPPPFAHSKLLMADDAYALLGSANLDPRSLRLNFEFNLEAYDANLASSLAAHFENVRHKSEEITLQQMDGLPLPLKLRNSFFKLLSPYL